ncbi:MAG: GTP-binding protein [Bacteroidales bacterium]|nr:GTP-binding protein [Bacteroidales bacterium]
MQIIKSMDKNFRKVLTRIKKAKQKNLTELDLSNLEITELPEQISELTNLTDLNLNSNQLSSLPDSFSKLINLKTLYLGDNQLNSLPESISELTNLTDLDLDSNQLSSLPESISKLTNLTNLNLNSNQLSSLPESISKLTNLTDLSLNNNQLSSLPESISKLTKLIRLTLNSNQLSSLPASISELTNLTQLSIENNQLTKLPESILVLRKLMYLYLDYNQLNSLPENISQLINLHELTFRNNKILRLPKSIAKLNKLKYFDLNYNQFSDFPESISKLINLEYLHLGNNQLSSLPENISKLTKLTNLELEINQLSSLPESISELINLEYLNLDSNQLSSLPESISELMNLTRLNLDSNQLSNLPESISKLTKLIVLKLSNNKFKVGSEIFELKPKEQIAEILKWQRAQKAGTLKAIHEAKVIFIGESNYGKTHLIELLRKGKIKRKIKTTHGIERNPFKVPYKDKDIRLNIWDLGGQEFMRSTHQFFFSERTLYILVTLARRERNELNHWLKLVNQLGNKAPVLVVINKIDLDSHDLDRKSLERDYPNIIGFVRTCINDCEDTKSNDSIDHLKEKITSIVKNKNIMPGVFEQRPPEWFAVKEELEKLEAKGTDFITYQEYEDLDFIKDIPADERKSNLKLLSMLGTVVSYVDDPRLIDTNVINPQWIIDGVYTIINDPKIKDEEKGRLLIKDLKRILPKKRFPEARHAYLLELMKKFNLCYAAKDLKDTYFIPDLFEDIEPDFEWDSDKSLHFRYNYDDFSPDTFITRFIVEMNQDILLDNRWRSGVYISNGSCTAKVYQSFRKNFINIEIMGNTRERRSYLYAIRETFRKLHNPFPQMQIKQEALYNEYWLDYLQLVKLEEKNKPFYHVELDEDLPITNILNGYSSPKERKGKLKIFKIFLASSSELQTDREQFEIFINRENNRLVEKGIFLKLELWEDFIDAMSQTRIQDEYNNVINNSDIFVSLFFTKVGKYTSEEFETAFGQFKKTGKPLVYTYFKDAALNTSALNRQDSNSLFDFQDKLKELRHFQTVYKNIESLQLHFKKQLEKVLANLE